jgi:hypothetical protein
MPDTDPILRALRELPKFDVEAARASAILARAQAALSARSTPAPSWIADMWSRVVAPTLVTATVASYLLWAVSAAGALYR